MEIIRAEILGFCSGVRGAVNTAVKSLSEQKTGNVYTLGPLIHNPLVLEKLGKQGLKIINEDEFSILTPQDTVIIRAHGVPPATQEKLAQKGCIVKNAACPLVRQSQKRTAMYAEQGYNIIFTGDKNHGEMIGIEGFAVEAAEKAGIKLNFFLVKDLEEVKSLLIEKRLDPDRKTVLLSQTTFSIKVFAEIKKILEEELQNLECVQSICPATYSRQEALEKLCSQVEGVIVIGGKNSANTNRLYATASRLCKKAALIETASEIPEDFFKLNKVGITAGASTPDDIIEEVEDLLQKGVYS